MVIQGRASFVAHRGNTVACVARDALEFAPYRIVQPALKDN